MILDFIAEVLRTVVRLALNILSVFSQYTEWKNPSLLHKYRLKIKVGIHAEELVRSSIWLFCNNSGISFSSYL